MFHSINIEGLYGRSLRNLPSVPDSLASLESGGTPSLPLLPVPITVVKCWLNLVSELVRESLTYEGRSLKPQA